MTAEWFNNINTFAEYSQLSGPLSFTFAQNRQLNTKEKEKRRVQVVAEDAILVSDSEEENPEHDPTIEIIESMDIPKKRKRLSLSLYEANKPEGKSFSKNCGSLTEI